MNEPKPKSVFLRPEGQAPTWGHEEQSHTPMDQHIAAGANADLATQIKLYRGLALQLQGNQLHEATYDRTDDEEWLRRLALWFGWDQEFQREQDSFVLRTTYDIDGEF